MSGSAGIGARFVMPFQTLVDAAGIPIAGGHAYFYATGTATLQSTYADVGLTIANANPLIADAAGRFQNVFMLPAPAYRVRITDANDAIIGDYDPVGPAAAGATGTVPVGGLQIYAGSTPPAGWLFCDGSAISRTVFSVLFSRIGTTFGAGDGATTFNIPDLRGRVVAGVDTMGGVAANRLTSGGSGINANVLGGTGGDEMSQLHNHTLNDPTHWHDDEGHTHTTDGSHILTGGTLAASGNFPLSIVADTIGTSHAYILPNSTGITLNSWGAGGSQNAQPTIALNFIIFVG